jgi:signal transduction histidine kinase
VVTSAITPARVQGDRAALERVVRNLVDNAVRHARTAITLSLSRNGSSAELTVADDGPGIPREARERVFDRFVRLDEDRARTAGGTGLGLPIARDIVVAHGGTLTLDDFPGGGTAATISLPLALLRGSSGYPPSGSSR